MTEDVLTKYDPASTANWESRLGFLFGIILLIVAGGTATLVGYKVKQAQIIRQAELKVMFHKLVGPPESITDSSQALTIISGESPPRRTFVAAYQLNEWVRTAGLYRALNELDRAAVPAAITALQSIGATEAFKTTQETWSLLHGIEAMVMPLSTDPLLTSPPQRARRIAKRYDRTFIRDVESKLYRFLHGNSKEF
jgi:hypothetical protein